MINPIGGSNLFNLYSVGNVGNYSANQVKFFMHTNGLSSSSGYPSTSNSNLFKDTLFTRNNTDNLSDLKSASSALNSAAQALGSGARSLVSSDNKVVTAQASYHSDPKLSFDIDVSDIATAQQSESKVLSSSAKSTFTQGTNSVSLKTEQGNIRVDFAVKSTDTNQDTLNTIASKINAAKAGVTASVKTKDGKSSLVLTSNETGEKSAFSIEASNTSSAADRLGMNVTQTAGNAKYSINGKEYTSESNTISIPDSRNATMTLRGEGSATLTVGGTDASKVVAAAKDFAAAYNKTISHLMSGSADSIGAKKALNLISDNRYSDGYASSRLSSMGISIDKNGRMQVDEDKLTQAVQKSPASVQSALSGYGSLADSTGRNADRAMRMPSASYTNLSTMQSGNSLMSMFMPKTGFLFDLSL